jgi:hypothetical protein
MRYTRQFALEQIAQEWLFGRRLRARHLAGFVAGTITQNRQNDSPR